MPNKTDRILSYLPRAFQTFPRPPALFALVDALGSELTQAENSLAAVMSSHWVDLADKNAEQLQDLLLFAALYGLQPREDESIEEFRDHLKRYVRTFIDGTVTVQGVLRVAAEALGLRIADSYDDMDTWWRRPAGELTTTAPGGAHAAVSILGGPVLTARGSSISAAQVSGTVNPAARSGTTLLIKIDAVAPKQIDLGTLVDPAKIADQINTAVGQKVAIAVGQVLTLTSPTSGPASRLEISDVANDAAPWVLGLPPHSFQGAGAQPAQITGSVDLSGGVSLGDARYLRLTIDAKAGEIDLTGGSPAPLTLEQIKTAINLAFAGVATHDAHFLTITSPTKGAASKIVIGEPGAQNARAAVFGTVSSAAGGLDPVPARVTGTPDLAGGVDLSVAGDIRVRLDGAPAVRVHCAGADPSNTQLAEIVQAINFALKATVATHNGHNITLTSTKTGPSSSIAFESIPGGDALQTIFAIGPRAFSGAAATQARVVGTADLSAGVDVCTQPLLSIAVDQSPAVVIDLTASKDNPAQMSPGDVASAINAGLGINAGQGKDVASSDGAHLILTSPTSGGASRISVQPPLITKTESFVTRAAITGEAAEAIFGAATVSAQGAAGQSATLTGTVDLSHGVDLRVNRFLRLVVDGRDAIEIDCAGDRPRATLPDAVVHRINHASPGSPASTDGKHLVLTSPFSGAVARLAIEPSRSADALNTLLGVDPGTYRGSAATGVVFAGLVDLSAGIDLDTKAAINIAIDAGPATEISLAGDAPNHKTIGDILSAIGGEFTMPVARTDGLHIVISSPTTGATSTVSFNPPAGTDVTMQLFGIAAPREYHGANAAPGRVVGRADLSAGAYLRVAHSLRLGLDDMSSSDIDCSQKSLDHLDHASLQEIVGSLNLVLGTAASHDGKHLIITSRNPGPASFVKVEPHTSADASQALLGDSPLTASGKDATPAVITASPAASPLDLSARDRLRLSVDGGPDVDLAVPGSNPAKTTVAEIMAAINHAFPGLADLTPDSAVRLTSPTAGTSSSLSVATLRYLELIEYPPEPASSATISVSTGTGWIVVNRGAADTPSEVTITSLAGVSKPAVINRTLGWMIRLQGVLGTGESLRLRAEVDGGIRADILSAESQRRTVPSADIVAGPLGIERHIPFKGSVNLIMEPDGVARLELNNARSAKVIVVSARDDVDPASISITVAESTFVDAPVQPPANGQRVRLTGRLEIDARGGSRLRDPLGVVLAQLRSARALDPYNGHSVIVKGTLYPDATPVLVVDDIGRNFQVNIASYSKGVTVAESYPFVTVGEGADSDSLVTLINAGTKFGESSKLLKATEYDKSTALSLPQGRSEWLYIDCEDSRFNQAIFDYSNFAGGACRGQGVFNVSRFDKAVFAFSGPQPARAQIDMAWKTYRAGAFTLNLPDDLPDRFGGRFNQARFGQPLNTPEAYDGAVTEPVPPPPNPNFLRDLINGRPSDLVTAAVVNPLPDGRTAVTLPFRKDVFLSGGDDKNPAKLYLAEEGLVGFIELTAREPGKWGNQISVTGRSSGPAIYDVTITFQGARFENARQVAQGPDLPASIADLLKPAPVGVLQAKAAGVRMEVTRDGVQFTTQQQDNNQTLGETK